MSYARNFEFPPSTFGSRNLKTEGKGAGAPGRRLSVRYAAHPDTVGKVSLQVGGPEVPVRILNLSLGGISLEINQKIDVGSLLALSLLNAARGASYFAVLRVLSSHPVTEPEVVSCQLSVDGSTTSGADQPTTDTRQLTTVPSVLNSNVWRVGAVFTQSLSQEAFKRLI